MPELIEPVFLFDTVSNVVDGFLTLMKFSSRFMIMNAQLGGFFFDFRAKMITYLFINICIMFECIFILTFFSLA